MNGPTRFAVRKLMICGFERSWIFALKGSFFSLFRLESWRHTLLLAQPIVLRFESNGWSAFGGWLSGGRLHLVKPFSFHFEFSLFALLKKSSIGLHLLLSLKTWKMNRFSRHHSQSSASGLTLRNCFVWSTILHAFCQSLFYFFFFNSSALHKQTNKQSLKKVERTTKWRLTVNKKWTVARIPYLGPHDEPTMQKQLLFLLHLSIFPITCYVSDF